MVKLVPDGDPMFVHSAEGDDDMPAHIRTILTQNAITLPVNNGKAALGVWQGVYLWEHRVQSYKRRVVITVTGE